MSWLTAVLFVAAGTIATLLGLALTAVITLLVRGAVPGSRGGDVVITPAIKLKNKG